MAYIAPMTRGASRFAAAFARARGGTSKVELAEKSGIGRRTLTRWEVEDGEPSLEQLRRIVRVLPDGADDMLRSLDLLPPSDEDMPAAEHLSDPDERALWNLGVRRDWDEPTRMHLIFALRARRMDATERALIQERIRASIAERDDADHDSPLASRDEPA